MKNILAILLITFSIIRCKSNKPKDVEPMQRIVYKDFKFKFPIILDSLNIHCHNKKQIWLEDGLYNPFYIGPIVDSCYNTLNPKIEDHFFYAEDYKDENHFLCQDSTELLFLIDTNTFIVDDMYMTNPETGEYGQMFYNAHPVFIVNKTNDTIDVGYGDHIPIFMEAKDDNGVWQPIEECYVYTCGFRLNNIFLAPGEMVITTVPIYQGNFKTKLRLRYYYGMCSQEFSGSINLSQFESEWDEYGNRKQQPNK